jgi:hypothetical protein
MNTTDMMNYIASAVDFESDDGVERIEANVIPSMNSMVIYVKDDDEGLDTAFVLSIEQRRNDESRV